MSCRKQVINAKIEEQRKLQNFVYKYLKQAMLELLQKHEENNKSCEQILEVKSKIKQNDVTSAFYKEAIEGLLKKCEDSQNSQEHARQGEDQESNGEFVNQKFLDHIESEKPFGMDLALIDVYEKLHNLLISTKTPKQIQAGLDEDRREKDRYVVENSKIQKRLNEKKRRIAEKDYQAQRNIIELEGKIQSAKQQYEDLDGAFQSYHDRVLMLESKKEHLQKELKKKQQLKAMAQGLYSGISYSEVLKDTL